MGFLGQSASEAAKDELKKLNKLKILKRRGFSAIIYGSIDSYVE
jgi:hypothetical protein